MNFEQVPKQIKNGCSNKNKGQAREIIFILFVLETQCNVMSKFMDLKGILPGTEPEPLVSWVT